MSLRKKIIISFFICICIAFFPFMIILKTKITPMNLSQIKNNTLQLVESKSNEIGSWLNQRISEIKIINEFPGCKTLNFNEIKPYISALNDALQPNYGNIAESFAIGGLDGIGWVNDDISIDISQRAYFKNAMITNSPYTISEPVISKSSENPIFLICYPILTDNNDKIGFINGAISLDLFTKITESLNVYDSFSWIMNNNSEVYTTTYDNFSDTNLSLIQLKTITSQISSSTSGIINLKKLINNDSTLFYSKVPYAKDWIFCTLIDNQNLHSQTDEFVMLIYKVITLLLISAIITAIFLSFSITKSLEQFKKNMLQVSNGNLNSFYKCKKKDEISVLGNVFNTMLIDIENLISEKDAAHELKRSAELKALQSQINPHFLYNTLDTIQWKALSHQAYDVVNMIQLLSKLFRLSLNNGNEFTTINEELEHVETYLKIQKIRYNKLINYNIKYTFPPDKAYYIPKLIIQPLVENSIYHGIKPKKSMGAINITVSTSNNEVIIKVSDNGIGISQENLNKLTFNLKNSIKSNHYGLYNVNERIKLTFGDSATINIESEECKETTIYIKIPIMEEKDLVKFTHS